MPDPVTLDRLAAAVGGTPVGEAVVDDVTHDSRRVTPGAMFAAVRGFVTDGTSYVPDAIAAGAAALCVDDVTAAAGHPALVVPDVRAVLGRLAAAIHGNPSERLRLIGVTGTNGKTTVTHLLESIATSAGMQQGLIGTIGARINGEPIEIGHTTPEATDLQRLLRVMVDAGVDLVAMEVSSHGLSLGRVDATRFVVGGFTNLSQDHLDFHETMDDYVAAKAKLFEQTETAVIWTDDPVGADLAAGLGQPVVRVGYGSGADITGDPVVMSLRGSTFDARGPGGGARINLRLPGRFNMANALVAAACMNSVGVSWDTIADGIGRVGSIPGRFEVVETPRDCTIVVDYAHTPAGIENVVAAARELAGGGRVVALVGAGGDRDRDKRPGMGAAAATADVTVITTDNPRSEDPEKIAADVAAGAGPDAVVVADRRQAIRRALDLAGEGDVVLVLGKGHEASQEVAGRLIPFDDRAVVREEASA